MSKNLPIHIGFLYYHPNSYERSTSRKKGKYKLLVNILPILNLQLYVIGTSGEYLKENPRALETTFEDWQNITAYFYHINNLKTKIGYFCWDNCDKHLEDEMVSKFYYVAELKREKFIELESKKKLVHVYAVETSTTKEKLTFLAINEADIAEEAAKRLNLI